MNAIDYKDTLSKLKVPKSNISNKIKPIRMYF